VEEAEYYISRMLEEKMRYTRLVNENNRITGASTYSERDGISIQDMVSGADIPRKIGVIPFGRKLPWK